MSVRIERTIRVVGEGEEVPSHVTYWRTRSAQERLAETLKLHREGNDLFRGGHPDFVYVIRARHVDDPR